MTSFKNAINKLKKPRPADMAPSAPSATMTEPFRPAMSRTMQLAVGGLEVSKSRQALNRQESGSTSVGLQRSSTWFSAPLAAAPRTKVEQYWAARALVAETLLSARVEHHDELTEMRLAEEEKRTREIATLVHANDRRQNRLEKFVAALVACLMLILGVVVYVAIVAPDYTAKQRTAASHFTIPILSPFTSVVEHETGVFGTKAVTIFVLVIGVAFYFALRRWLGRWPTR